MSRRRRSRSRHRDRSRSHRRDNKSRRRSHQRSRSHHRHRSRSEEKARRKDYNKEKSHNRKEAKREDSQQVSDFCIICVAWCYVCILHDYSPLGPSCSRQLRSPEIRRGDTRLLLAASQVRRRSKDLLMITPSQQEDQRGLSGLSETPVERAPMIPDTRTETTTRVRERSFVCIMLDLVTTRSGVIIIFVTWLHQLPSWSAPIGLRGVSNR